MTNLRSAALQSWLSDAGSFMKRLREHQLPSQVVVLKQSWSYPQAAERAILGVRPQRYVFIREVEIQAKQEPLLFARVAIPASTLTGPERRLAQLGSSSLGSVLFSYPGLERSPFEIKPCQLLQYSSSLLWERQSLFHLRGKPLLLTEVFLPRLVQFIESL